VARLTRKERQARTRRRLVDAAARVGARRGLAAASLDEVAQAAGYTKGAVYANFVSKEELFLAVLDERFAERLEQIERVFDTDAAPTVQAAEAGAELSRAMAADRDWQRLFLEFAVHAARDAAFRERLTARYRTLRERIAAILERRMRETGVTADVSPADLALMTFAMANGVALESLLEPEAVPDDLLARMYAILAAGAAHRDED
jgi:AcrR family transcriptional regulator